MVYETSYDGGRKPFAPDLTRGYWSSSNDFLLISMALAFKMDFFGLSWYNIGHTGIYVIFPYLLSLLIYGVPLMVVQLFLGQFSSSGFISSLRISPFFRGIGFVSLCVNILISTYYIIFAAVPLLYFFNSFRPSLPWSCDKAEIFNISTICEPIGVEEDSAEFNATDTEWRILHVPSVLYFKTYFSNINLEEFYIADFEFSWAIWGCNVLIWAIIFFIFFKYSETEKLGRILKYLVCTTIGILIICVIRFSFLPGSEHIFEKFFDFRYHDVVFGLSISTLAILNSLGGGWGVISTLASHNKFKTDIVRYSWIIGIGQMLINMGFGLITTILEGHYQHNAETSYISYIETHWVLYLSSGTAISNLHWANLWSILYFGMLTMSAVLILIIQIMTILTSVFDEFEYLRNFKMETTMGFIGFLALVSTYFCSNHGLLHFFSLAYDSLFTTSTICLIMLFVVLWVYGRERFQRDIEFMLSRCFPSWQVFTLRFIAPLGLFLAMVFAAIMAVVEHSLATSVVLVGAIFFIIIPWLFIPMYGVLGMLQTSGTFCMRFRRCCRPTDWYPVDREDRQRYEEKMGNMDATHQLNEVLEDVL